jgi:hypothetical protein
MMSKHWWQVRVRGVRVSPGSSQVQWRRERAHLVCGKPLCHSRCNCGVGRAVLQQHGGGTHQGSGCLQIRNAVSNHKLAGECEVSRLHSGEERALLVCFENQIWGF